MPKSKVGDVNLYYEIHGEGEPLVLIMGYGGNAGEWFSQIPVLSEKYRVLAFDNRGAGQSDKPDVPYTMQMLAQDLAGLLDALAIDSAHVYGVSMGGMIAQEFALQCPEKAISLILGCTTCGGTHAVMPDVQAMTVLLDFERMKRLTPEEACRESLPFLYTNEFIDRNPNICDYWVAKRLEYRTPLQGYVRQAEAITGHDTYDRLPYLKAPTLVIAGTEDKLVPVENSRILAAVIPNAELVLLDNAGHGFFIEVAEEANRVILDFLRRHPKKKY